jgi:hypothetical protein
VYEAFSHINRRFRSLLTNSTLPIKINVSSISKAAFKRYNTNIIIPNTHRINSLRLRNQFVYDLLYSPVHRLSQFSRLETLNLENVQAKHLETLLLQLFFLPYFSSLIITTVDQVTNKNCVYRKIFRLPALKYCKLTFGDYYNSDVLPFATNEYSPIEHLVIDNDIYLDQLPGFLSYVPKIRRLSFRSLCGNWSKQTELCPVKLNHLTHVSLKLDFSTKFDAFKQLLINVLSSVQVLRISAGREYMDANIWKQLILSYLPNLRIFDIRFGFLLSDDAAQLASDDQINQFTSPFWIERQ